MRVLDWAPCGACDRQLELRAGADAWGAEDDWVHVGAEGDYVYRDHHPVPFNGRVAM
jgi:hypothetical protein